MNHTMKLNNAPFEKIKSGNKTIEMRLFDDKRRLLKVGDFIEFTNRENGEVILVKIKNLYKFNNFAELYNHFDKVSLGYNKNECANPSDMEAYYPQEEQKQFGVLAIEISRE